MRNILSLGVVSLVAVASVIACGDDDSGIRPGIGGTGGAGGASGGTGGTGGASGGTGGSGTGTAGTSATVGLGGAPALPTVPTANCTGCVLLSIPVGGTLPTGATAFQAVYQFNAAETGAPFDLTDVTAITWRIQALTTDASYYVQPILQNTPPEAEGYAFGAYPGNTALTSVAFAAGTWVDVSIDVTALAPLADAGVAQPSPAGEADAGDAGAPLLTAFDKSKTRVIGLQVGASSTAAVGNLTIELDSVTLTGTSNFTNKTFAAGAEGLFLNDYLAPVGSRAPAFY